MSQSNNPAKSSPKADRSSLLPLPPLCRAYPFRCVTQTDIGQALARHPAQDIYVSERLRRHLLAIHFAGHESLYILWHTMLGTLESRSTQDDRPIHLFDVATAKIALSIGALRYDVPPTLFLFLSEEL